MGSVLVCLTDFSRGRVRSAVCNALLPNRGDSGAARQLSCRECAATWHIIRMPPSGNSLDYSFETRRLQARAIRYAANALPLCSMGACGCDMSYLYHRQRQLLSSSLELPTLSRRRTSPPFVRRLYFCPVSVGGSVTTRISVSASAQEAGLCPTPAPSATAVF